MWIGKILAQNFFITQHFSDVLFCSNYFRSRFSCTSFFHLINECQNTSLLTLRDVCNPGIYDKIDFALLSIFKTYKEIDLYIWVSKTYFQFPDYAFQVNPVKKCPMNKEAWDISTARMNCNKTHGYHCVPNKILSSLIEFCYPRGKNILFEKGKRK